MTTKATGTATGGQQKKFHPHFGAGMVPLLLLTSIFFVNFLARIILAPLMPGIESDLAISHAEAGSLFLVISLGYFVSLLGSGFISSRLTHKRTIIFSAMTMGLALISISFCPGLRSMRLGAFCLGVAAGPYLPSAIATLTTLFESRHWGRAIAIHELAPNLSFVLAPLICEIVLYRYTWRAVFVLMGLVAMVLSMVFMRFGRGGDFSGDPLGFASVRGIVSKPVFWVMVALFGLAISSTLGIYSMLSLYLVTEHGMERQWANTVIGLSRVASIAVTFAGGWATDRFGPRVVLKAVFLLTGLTTVFIGVASSAWVTVAVFLQPIMAVCFFPAGLAALSMASSSGDRNIAVSLTVPLAFIMGGGATPTFVGYMGDVSSFGAGITLVGGAILLGSFISGFLKFKN